MISSRRLGVAGGLVLAGLLVAPALASPRIHARVGLDDLSSGELRVSLTIEDESGAVRRLWGVPVYVDNPVAEGRGEVVRDLRVSVDGEKARVLVARTPRGEPAWDLDEAVGGLEVSYTLRVDFVAGEMVEAYPILVPAMDGATAWLTGNHVFLTPGFGGERVRELRRDMEIRLEFDLPDGIALHGPPPVLRLRNLHELLSLQFGLGRFSELEVRGPGWSASLILREPAEFTRDEQVRLVGALREMVGDTVDLFGGAPYEDLGLFAFRAEGTGGLEGTGSAQAYLPADVDLADRDDPRATTFLRVAFHELVHTWLPISLFALDDPWFKEGVTSYYGHVLSARAGWIGPAEVEALFAGYDPEGLEPVGLADPRIWYEEYSGERWRRVTYDRGHAVALLLDLFLRQETGDRRSLDDVLRRLFREHRRSAFDRTQLLSAIEAATGVDAEEFFARRVDSTVAPSVAEVDRALRRALELGVYAPQ